MLSHVLFVAGGATTEAVARRHLRRQRWIVQEVEPGRALGEVRQGLPDLVVWASPDGWGDLRFDRATWNIPVVRLAAARPAVTDLLVEPDATLVDPSEEEFVRAVREAVAARDRRLREGVGAELRLLLPSALDQLEPLCLVTAEWFALCGLKKHANHQVNLAIRELAANAIEWGHHHDRSRIVHVAAWLEEDRVCALVRDTGPGFDRLNLPHAARPGDSLSHLGIRASRNLREGGFGILMATGLVDHLCYNEFGNEGLVVKFLPQPALASAVLAS